jgi:hypothetical protein
MNLIFLDSFYLLYMGWIKPKNHLMLLLSLERGTVPVLEIKVKANSSSSAAEP